jgi:hypothetical protein
MAGGDQLTVTERDEPAGGCLSAQPFRLIIPSSRRGDPSSREPVLLDRQTERDTIDGLLHAAEDGLSGALVLRGELGMGKTSLLEYAVAQARDMRVAWVSAIESEMTRRR